MLQRNGVMDGLDTPTSIGEVVAEYQKTDSTLEYAPTRSADELHFSELFAKLADEWHDQTDFLSSPTRIAMHPTYQRIIGMGMRAIPYILKDLRKRGGEWYWALRSIAGSSPVPSAAAGNSGKMKQAWLDWGRKNGYID